MDTNVQETGQEHEGGWFVVDGEVEFLDDVLWTPVVEDGPAAGGARHALVTGGEPTEHVGSTLELASATALDDARRSTVRRLWSTPIALVVAALVFTALELSGVPWRTSLGRQVLVALAVGVPCLAVAEGAWFLATRNARGRLVRAMGGHRTRGQYDRQRAVVSEER
ncbi:hypothetical protein BIU97_16940 [Curtobacterium sp. MCBA15_009]|uniref:hypothetical protein n=1 Tax=Curtobacterium sp. MCBA15_009 TaxID=1898737 RepID=UPI0008DC9731|nr:hypothetical protein [Curtobacterium sp. MCBA15_009]OII13636.1 hypothetical protein BIU97_16940 [Curtobacterium sp. MCBA15_009]